MTQGAEQGHNHNLDSIARNYSCPVSRLRVVSHNKTKCRENGNHEQNNFLSITHMHVYNNPLVSRIRTGPPPPQPPAGPGCSPSTFFMLIFLSVDGGRSRISSSGTSQGARRRYFLALMVDTPGSPAPAPPRAPAVNIF
jgi:hypothetical protein